MLFNYLKATLRNIRRNKVYTFITVIGLAVGIMSALFILTFSYHELSQDRFHPDVDRLYQVLLHTDVGPNSITPTPLAPLLKERYPEIVDVSRYHWFWGETLLQHGQDTFYEKGIRLVDPAFLMMFNFPFIAGNPQTALEDPNSIVLTQETAHKYFGDDDPLGETLTLNHEHPLTVTGVINNVPGNSSMQFDMLMPLQFNIVNYGTWYMGWNNLFVYTLVKTQENITISSLEEKIRGIVGEQGGSKQMSLSLLPFSERYFFFFSDRTTVIIFLSVAVFILLIAAFNFINLSTALSFRRAKEVGMRKVLGADRKQIVIQYLMEAVLLAFASAVLAGILFMWLLPTFRNIAGDDIVINASFILYSTTGIALCTGLLAGFYPALFLSTFRVAHVLKGRKEAGFRGGALRKGIVVFQFVLSILLMLGISIVYQQTRYIQTKDLGYDKDCLVSIPLGGGSEAYYQLVKTKLQNEPGVVQVTGSAAALPLFNWRIHGFQWEGKDPDEQISVSHNVIDYDFIETLDIRLIAGRPMSRDFVAEGSSAVYINEAMAELMGSEDLIGATMLKGDVPYRIVGILENFHFSSMVHIIEPLVLALGPEEIDNMLVRIRPENRAQTLERIRVVWNAVVPGYPFQYSFLDEDFERSLTSLKRTGYLLTAFSFIAIVISCLGLFGLSTFMAEQSTKEIGIRKVHGASASSIVRLLSMKFILLVGIANVIAWPLAYYLMNRWLDHFAYRISIQMSAFLVVTAASILIAFLSVLIKSVKAATVNPIQALRYE